MRDERCQSGDGSAAMRIVGTITVTAGSRSVQDVSDISRDETAFSGDESVLTPDGPILMGNFLKTREPGS